MHVTDTVHYAIVLDGDVWLELDDGKEIVSSRTISSFRLARATLGATKARTRRRLRLF
jgi:hypothetical protein